MGNYPLSTASGIVRHLDRLIDTASVDDADLLVKLASAIMLDQAKARGHYYYCVHCRKVCGDDYMLKHSVWELVGVGRYEGMLHMTCVEEILGRDLTPDDLLDVPANRQLLDWYAKGESYIE